MNIMGDILIIGGGPAGIISVCVYHNKYPNKKIIWVDDTFNVGNLSAYPNVYANTPYAKMIVFITMMYDLIGAPYKMELCNELEHNYFKLGCLCNEFKKITEIIKEFHMITTVRDRIISIKKSNYSWLCTGNKDNYMADKILLATGCIHKSLPYNKPQISIKEALNPKVLIKKNLKLKKLLVCGNSHSGILILKNLYDCGFENITCVYKHPIKIPFNKDGIEIFDQSGLRGVAKDWVEANILPENKTHIKFIKYGDNINDIVEGCDYIIYAIGLKQAVLPTIETYTTNGHQHNASRCYTDYRFDPETGKLCEGVYGIGVGFPAHYILGDDLECEVGIFEFLERANQIL